MNNKKNKNMITFNQFSKYFLAVTICAAFGACSNDDAIEVVPDVESEVSTLHTIPMKLVGDLSGFDQKTGTRAPSASWNEGDKIYLTFYNGDTTFPGEATYSASKGWSVSFDGALANGADLKCEARHFKDATFESASLVSLNSNSQVYEDANGKYSFVDDALTVYASLSPKAGRLRFKGTAGATIYTTGIAVYTTFSPGNNSFSTSSAMITSTVGSDGYTPYIYGLFADTDMNIGLVGDDFAFTRTCTADMLAAGESGYMAIPSEASHNSWRSGLYVKASGVEFKMIPVAGLESGFFLIGETEVTEALYKSVNGTASTSSLPKDNISYSNATSIIEKISNETKLNFALPDSTQWKYAAKGGNKSQGYTYAGSNTPGDVAWYTANTTSIQNVRTKAPNELGIYDMSGNVGEFVKSRNNDYPLIFGGGYCSSTDYITTSSYVDWNYRYDSGSYYIYPKNSGYETSSYGGYSKGIGFRMILTCP